MRTFQAADRDQPGPLAGPGTSARPSGWSGGGLPAASWSPRWSRRPVGAAWTGGDGAVVRSKIANLPT